MLGQYQAVRSFCTGSAVEQEEHMLSQYCTRASLCTEQRTADAEELTLPPYRTLHSIRVGSYSI
eukprot:985379-Rhodomonas_salina.1